MDLYNELSCEAGSFSHHLNPHKFFQSEVLRLYFSMLEPWVAWSACSPVVPPSLSTRKCGTAPFASFHLTLCTSHHPVCPSPLVAAFQESSAPQLPICTPPTCLDECFFFNSLVVRLPYSLIFLAVLVIFFI